MKTMKVILAALFVYLSVNCVNLINQELRLQKYHARLEQDMAVVKAQQAQLKAELAHYNTSEGVEELARKRLGYFKKGEIPLRVIESTPADAALSDTPAVN
ncbi:MAG: septum formation initiator family protein [Candidatus Sericytochromatia bacterium]|nr:septum formation initiator family protein [Candidatus Sericytochromatia bacterium]